jgi:hypothetical protein
MSSSIARNQLCILSGLVEDSVPSHVADTYTYDGLQRSKDRLTHSMFCYINSNQARAAKSRLGLV